jgi:hypothetical protein
MEDCYWNAYNKLFLWRQSGQSVKLTAHLQVVTTLRI